MADSLIFWASIVSVCVIITGWGVNEHFKRNAAMRLRLWEIKLEKFMEARRIVSALQALLIARKGFVEKWKDDDPDWNAAYFSGVFYTVTSTHGQVLRELGVDIPDTFKTKVHMDLAKEKPGDVIDVIYVAIERSVGESVGRLLSVANELLLLSESSEVSGYMLGITEILRDWTDNLSKEELTKRETLLGTFSTGLIVAMRNELDDTLQLRVLKPRRKRSSPRLA